MNWLPFAGSVISSLGSSLFSHNAANKAYERQKELWTYMQSNAHQLEVDDLRKAGLNPILSATNSQLASMPSVQQEHLPQMNIGEALTSAMQAAIQDKVANQNYELGKRAADQRDKEIEIAQENSASNIAYQQAQRDEVLERVKALVIDNKFKPMLYEKDLKQKEAGIRLLFAQIQKVVEESGLVSVQKDKLLSQLKYGEIFCKYLPPQLADKLIPKITTIIERTDFTDFFINKVVDGSDLKETALDYVKLLEKNGMLED